MTVHNIDIFRPEWLNVVFADRNQEYGAYQLRRDNARTTNMALLIALSSFVLLMAAPVIIGKVRGTQQIVTQPTIYDKHDIDNTVYKIIPPKAEQQQAKPAAAKPINNIIEDKPWVVTQDAKTEPPTDAQLKITDPGQVTMTGTHDGPPAIDAIPGPIATTGSGTGAGPAAGEGNNEIFKAAEISPEYPGGEAAFGRFLQKNIRYPQIAKENGIQGRAYLQFIVERDGSLTDIKIVRNPGGGTGEEAERVLKMSPHWKPGRQNGTNVRVQFTVPVNFSLGDQN
ncbi:energy transducer TonB [Mucilaginibacter sp. AW1-3]